MTIFDDDVRRGREREGEEGRGEREERVWVYSKISSFPFIDRQEKDL